MPCLRLSIVPHRRLPPVDLPRMVLYQRDLPAALRDFLPTRDNILDNETMAQQGFPVARRSVFALWGVSPATWANLRLRPQRAMKSRLATICSPPRSSTSSTTRKVCPLDGRDLRRRVFARVDQELHPGQRLLTVERLTPRGFADQAVGLRVLQSNEPGPVSSTIIDFRVGRPWV